MDAATRWLVGRWQWPYGGTLAAAFLVLLAPVIFAAGGWALLLVYLQLPAYMFHQLEEHANDRFRLYINATVGGGSEALTPMATFVINSAGVWAVDFVGLYLAWFVAPGWGLMAIYLPLLNAVVHVIATVAKRAYNPGVWTAILLLLPVGLVGWVAVDATHPTVAMQALGVGVAVAVHVAIIVHVKARVRRLRAAARVSGSR